VLVAEQNDEWLVGKRYVSEGSMARFEDPIDGRVPPRLALWVLLAWAVERDPEPGHRLTWGGDKTSTRSAAARSKRWTPSTRSKRNGRPRCDARWL